MSADSTNSAPSTGNDTSESRGDATNDTASTAECEIAEQETCWEAPDGTAFPELPSGPQGECRFGLRSCMEDGTWGACEGAVAPAEADSCEVAGADNDCNGVANEGCSCTGSETRGCGLATGNCEPGTQTCQNDAWGPCDGGVAVESQDSCATVGDDANCNGVPNEGCPCVGDQTETCGDCATRTCDPVNREWQECAVQSGSCTIDGVCIGHNATNPDNACQYCDVALNQSGWTNSPSSASCDDRLWCNGADTCNGSGECVHEFAASDRCSGGAGVCDRTTCSEESRSCYQPNTTMCDQTTEQRCSSAESCGASIETREVAQFCNGSSSDCGGALVPGPWQPESQCNGEEICTSAGNAPTCQSALDCVAWCDPATDLCWRHDVQEMNFATAESYCAGATWAGETNWRLPTIGEWIDVFRGCDNGTRPSDVIVSSCNMLPSGCVATGGCDDVSSCTACPENEGPDDADGGCYWESSLSGSCTSTFGFWSTTPGAERWVASPRDGTVSPFGVSQFTLNAQCVVPRN